MEVDNGTGRREVNQSLVGSLQFIVSLIFSFNNFPKVTFFQFRESTQKDAYVISNFQHLISKSIKNSGMKILITALATVILFACNSTYNKSEAATDLINPGNKPEEQEKLLAGLADSTGNNFFQVSDKKKGGPNQKQQPAQTLPPPKIDWDKKIIKTAHLNLEVKKYNEFYKLLRERVTQLGGYVAQEQQTQTDYKLENTLVIKVPVEQFDYALSQVTAGVEKVNEKRISSEDVTAEVVDTKSRIEAKRQIRLKYLELLKQARNMEEILNVQSEINSVQEDIESAAGRVNYLTHSAAYSTINLTFYEVLNALAVNNDKSSFATRISSAFTSGWNWVGELFVGLISIWPLLVLIAVILILYKRMRPVKIKSA
jgi:hypothetical protein